MHGFWLKTHLQEKSMNRLSQKNEWETWPEALRLFLRGATLLSCLPVALIVGLLLSTINQSN